MERGVPDNGEVHEPAKKASVGDVVVINTYFWPREGKREAVKQGLARCRRPVRVREGYEVIVGISECSAGLWGGFQDVVGQHWNVGCRPVEDVSAGCHGSRVGAVTQDVPGVGNLGGAKGAGSATGNGAV
jgi:hypothetical protein